MPPPPFPRDPGTLGLVLFLSNARDGTAAARRWSTPMGQSREWNESSRARELRAASHVCPPPHPPNSPPLNPREISPRARALLKKEKKKDKRLGSIIKGGVSSAAAGAARRC